MDKKFSFLAVAAAFALMFFSALLAMPALATTYLEAYATGIVQPENNITISGQIVNTSTSDTIAGINVSASATSGGNSSSLSGATGTFTFNITSPSTVGSYDVTVTSVNESTPHTKTMPVYVSNVTGGSVAYTSNSPPFSAGDTFTINVTLLNETNSSDIRRVSSYRPTIAIYAANGQAVSWTITNNSVSSDANGLISYNITVGSSATPGEYAIVVDKGAIYNVFSVQSGYQALVNPETANGEVTLNFAPSSTVMILAQIKTTAGVAVSSGISSVTAYVTLQNGTVRTITLQARNQTTYPGYYNNSFTETSTSGIYNVRVDAVVGSTTVQGSTLFNVKSFNARLEPQTEFFDEWGGSAAFGVGETVGLNIIATNLTSDETFIVPTHIPACNVTYLKLVDVYYPNGTSINSTMQTASFTTGRYMMNQVCRVQLPGPNASSPYGIKVNVTVGGVTETAEGYFSIQKYFLKPTVVSGFGGEMEMMSMVTPGENITISLSAYNITNNVALTGENITNVVVKKLMPLKFSLGIGEFTTSNLNYTVSYGSTPTITLTVPSTLLGPTSVELEASIGGETVSGNTFFVANYLMGMFKPLASEGAPSGMPFGSCSGTQTFKGSVMEAKTKQAVKSGAVVVNAIAEATEDLTGKDVSSYVMLAASGTTDSSGEMRINITFSPSYSFSGPYFIVLNASYQSHASGMPSQFMCKNLNFWPQIYSIGSTDETWRIAPTSGVRIIIANITRMNDTRKIRNATVKLPRLFNFNPSKGGERILTPTTAFSNWVDTNWINWTNVTDQPYNVTSNIANFTIYPQNFTLGGQTLTSWPNGFIDIQPMIYTESLGGSSDSTTWSSDTGFGGFQVVPFDSWVENFGWGELMAVNTTRSYIISVKTNVSLNCSSSTECDRANGGAGSVYTGTNNTGFTVKIGRPWEGELTTLSGVIAELVDDGWDNTNNSQGERWRINFTIPATTRKGEAQIMITTNNSYGETSDTDVWTTFSKYTISIPYEEGVQNWWGSNVQCGGGAPTGGVYDSDTVTIQGVIWNLTEVNRSLNIWSKSCGSSGHGMIAAIPYFNSTRYAGSGGNQQFNLLYNSSLKLLLIDNGTAGVLNVVVMNNSDGQLSWASESNRTISYNAYGVPGVYLVKIDGQYIRLANASSVSHTDVYGALPSWGGQDEVNKLHTIPYVVKLGNNPIVGAEVHANGIIKQSDEGFGVESQPEGGYNANGLIASGQNYSYINGTTDSMGMAFLKINVTNSGRFQVFWKVNTSTDYDIATMSSGTQIELRRFNGWGSRIYWLPQGRTTLYWANNTCVPGPGNCASNAPIWNAFGGSNNDIFNGTIAEAAETDFIRDNRPSTWRIAYNPLTNQTCFDDDSNFTYGNSNPNDPVENDTADYPVSCFYWNTSSNNLNTTFGASESAWMSVGSVVTNTTATANSNNNITVVFFQDNPTQASLTVGQYENVSVKICAEDFSVPRKLPIEGVSVKLFAMNYETNGPPQRKWLTLYNPINDTIGAQGGNDDPSSTNIVTGPKGCVAFNMTYPNGWPVGCREVQGAMTRGSYTENTWVGRFCR